MGSVVMNRVKQTNGSIEGVIFAKNQFSTAKKGISPILLLNQV